MALVVVGVLAIAAVAVVALQALRGDSGGASSPEAAVEQLGAALEAEDPVAALEVMAPEEVEALSDVVASASDRAAALGFAPEERTFGGVDLTLTGERLESTEVADGLARVTIASGSADIEVDPDGLGSATQAYLDEVARSDGEEEADDSSVEIESDDLIFTDDGGEEVEPFVMVVERGGGWYVSPLYTAAQYLVDALDLDAPALPAPDAGDGAESPEEAVRELLLGAGASDGARTGDLTAGDTGEAVRAYAGALEEWVGTVADDTSAEIDTFETEVRDREGGGKQVVVTDLEGTVSWTDDDGEEVTSTVTWDGDCLTVGDAASGEDIEDDEEEPDLCLTDGWARVGVDELAVAVVDEDGGWRVDALGTVGDYATAMAPELTEPMVLRALGYPEAGEPVATIEPGDPVPVELSEAGTAVVTVDLVAGEDVTVNASAEDDRDVQAYLVTPDGEYRSAYDLFHPEADGAHTLVVQTDAWGPGEVMVGVSPVRQESMTVGEEVSGEITGPGDVVQYDIELEDDTSYDVTLDGPDLDLQVVDPDGYQVTLVDDDDDGVPTLETSLPGTYQVRVAPGFDDATGSYTLLVDGGGQAFVLGDGSTDSAEGEITGPDSEQYIDIEVTGGREVNVDITTDDAGFDIVLILRDPATDEELDRYDSNGPGGFEGAIFTPDETTSWRVAVQGKNGTTGTFLVEAYEG